MTTTEQPVCGIRQGQLYLAREVVWRCGISSRTLTKWIDQGLRVCRPGTKERFFLGDDVIEFVAGRRARARKVA